MGATYPKPSDFSIYLEAPKMGGCTKDAIKCSQIPDECTEKGVVPNEYTRVMSDAAAVFSKWRKIYLLACLGVAAVIGGTVVLFLPLLMSKDHMTCRESDVCRKIGDTGCCALYCCHGDYKSVELTFMEETANPTEKPSQLKDCIESFTVTDDPEDTHDCFWYNNFDGSWATRHGPSSCRAEQCETKGWPIIVGRFEIMDGNYNWSIPVFIVLPFILWRVLYEATFNVIYKKLEEVFEGWDRYGLTFSEIRTKSYCEQYGFILTLIEIRVRKSRNTGGTANAGVLGAIASGKKASPGGAGAPDSDDSDSDEEARKPKKKSKQKKPPSLPPKGESKKEESSDSDTDLDNIFGDK